MIENAMDSESLHNFAADPSPYMEKLQESGDPLLLTVEGKVTAVIQDAASYQRILEKIDRLETLAAIKDGLEDIAAGRTRPWREVMDELSSKHNLSPIAED
jgi:PHD/YefM family antitoxin component YafN of YafNO toxin-antitoxin module